MNTPWLTVGIICLFGLISSCDRTEPVPDGYEPGEELSGGEAGTHFDFSTKAFDRSAPGISADNFDNFQVGNSFFRSSWVASPSSTSARDGLGPLYNSISCTGCHVRDGRGAPPEEPGSPLISMLARLSIPGQSAVGGPLMEPIYGTQLQNRSINGVTAEGELLITYEEIEGTFADGTAYSLRQPSYSLTALQYGAPAGDVMISPRVAPAVFGLGLLEAIPEASLLLLTDETDIDGDGISGRPNWVYDFEQKKAVVGRFGWKANQPGLRQQNAGAFGGDLGLTTPIFPDPNCTEQQDDCLQAPNGGSPEITEEMLDFVTAYTRALGVPARREAESEEVLQGKSLFLEIGCASCHVPSHQTEALPGFPEYANQTIYPYTDLLLHDMGEGLADHRPDYLASGTEWRTPPLWGIGLIETVNGHNYLLHDGRARSITEAILWHGGEGEASQQAFKALSQEERSQVIHFIESL